MNNIELITIEELQKILKISRSKAYSITNEKGFPVIKIGKNKRIIKEELIDWLKGHKKNDIINLP